MLPRTPENLKYNIIIIESIIYYYYYSVIVKIMKWMFNGIPKGNTYLEAEADLRKLYKKYGEEFWIKFMWRKITLGADE